MDEKLFGVVFSGGKSLRMGTDKGLIPIGGTCWAAFMGAKLHNAGLKYLVSVNTLQLERYLAYFNKEDLINDSNDLAGPIAGLYSIYTKYPENDILLLACDMIDMQPETIDNLIKIYSDEPQYDFYVYQNENFAEPFCAIYSFRGLKNLFEALSKKQLSGSSLQMIFDRGNTRRINITNLLSFKNRNKMM